MIAKMKGLYFKHKEIVNYFIFGVATTLVNMVIYYLLMLIPLFSSHMSVELFGSSYDVGYLLANAIAFIGAVIFSYFANRHFVFENKVRGVSAVIGQFFTFLGTRLLSFGIEELLLLLLVEVLFVSEYIAKWPVAVIVVVLNYVFGKLIVFRRKKD